LATDDEAVQAIQRNRVEGGEVMKIAVILTPCEEGGFSARVPTLSGCFGEGETVEEALIDIRQAIELHVEAVEDDLVTEDDERVFELVWHASRTDSNAAGPGPEAGPALDPMKTPPESATGTDRPERSADSLESLLQDRPRRTVVRPKERGRPE
jgi:predicted RNase H-like HicB family nuclease